MWCYESSPNFDVWEDGEQVRRDSFTLLDFRELQQGGLQMRHRVGHSPDRFTTPVIGVVSRDGKYLAAVANDSAGLMWRAYFHCVHNNPNWMPANEPSAQQQWRMKVYVMKNDPNALLARVAKDFPNAAQLRQKTLAR